MVSKKHKHKNSKRRYLEASEKGYRKGCFGGESRPVKVARWRAIREAAAKAEAIKQKEVAESARKRT